MERSKNQQLQSSYDSLGIEYKKIEQSLIIDKGKLKQREKDIEDLEVALEDLKETMQTEFSGQMKEADLCKKEI